MLKLSDIKKHYVVGQNRVDALRGVSINFRKSEFVAILGQSGCGKTTLLNIIGGLDRASDGDLVIKGRSTKKFGDRDWDTYRNHSVGFVFQSYNLIPHQTVLANVELALTLSGVKKAERKRRALEALERVGLAGQGDKKPNQLSGGQMQRVAIARAIVNDPEILLADEPTGALDSETSVQVMDILKEIAKDRLVIMVTHNPELADIYASRIIRLKDGLVVDDSSPYTEEDEKNEEKVKVNRSMSFFTALGLSMNNLLTKKGRTIMTCFAGSIGIIGIALILSVSNGVNNFIARIQEDTLTEYPLTISEEQIDLSSMLGPTGDGEKVERPEREEGYVYESAGIRRIMKAMSSITTTKNNVKDFKHFLDTNERIQNLTSSIHYSYNLNTEIYYKDADGKIVKSDSDTVLRNMYKSMGIEINGASSSIFSAFTSQMNVWTELTPGKDGEPVISSLKNQFDVLAGRWPESKEEVVLVLTDNGELSDFVLYAMGLKTAEEFDAIIKSAMKGETPAVTDVKKWSYDELMSLEFRLIPSPNKFVKNEDGTYSDISGNPTGLSVIYNDDEKSIPLKIVGIIRQSEDANGAGSASGGIGYTTLLTDYIISATENSEIVKAQLADKTKDVFTALPFPTGDNVDEKDVRIAKMKEYIGKMNEDERASLYIRLASVPSAEYLEQAFNETMASLSRDELIDMILQSAGNIPGLSRETFEKMTNEQIYELIKDRTLEMISEAYSKQVSEQLSVMPKSEVSKLLDVSKISDDVLYELYPDYFETGVSESTYEENIRTLGYVDKETPSTITIYTSTFANKEEISAIVDEYNASVDEADRIRMTDLVAVIISSVTTIIDAISYVLIAFVAISLVVSSIMIGVITNISVLERTKEIGILRSVGASKSDISRVFNAETFVIGLLSGVLGIAVTAVLIIPINIILHSLTGLSYLSAALPVGGAIILIVLSMVLTVIAGLIPSRSAANKDPVIALRQE